MLSFPHRASLEGIADMALEPRLKALLTARIDRLATPCGDLVDMTHIVVVEPGDTEDDLLDEIGLSPLINPIDGARYGTPDFYPH